MKPFELVEKRFEFGTRRMGIDHGIRSRYPRHTRHSQFLSVRGSSSKTRDNTH